MEKRAPLFYDIKQGRRSKFNLCRKTTTTKKQNLSYIKEKKSTNTNLLWTKYDERKQNNSCDLKTNVNLELQDLDIQKTDRRLKETENEIKNENHVN